MTPVELSRTVLHAVRRAVDGGELSVSVPERVVVGPPGPGGCGDYATNVALQLARPAGLPPLRVAGIIRARLLEAGSEHAVEDVVVTPPGFLNIHLRNDAAASLVADVLRCGTRYGHASDVGRPFSGPVLTFEVAHEVRALVVMDVVARLLRTQGADVGTIHVQTAPQIHPRTVVGASPEETSDDDAPDDARWAQILGLEAVASHRQTPEPLPSTSRGIRIRPVPSPGDPTTLGRDAARWALLHPAPHDRPRLGGEHLVQRESNPLFRVRYAHARTRALLRNAADLGFAPEPGALGLPAPESGLSDEARAGRSGAAGVAEARPGTAPTTGTGTTPTKGRGTPATAGTASTTTATNTAHTAEAAARVLLAALADHPRVLRAAASAYAPDRLARHLVDVADAVLPFLPVVLPVGGEKPSAAHRARLALAEAAGTVLAGGLSLLGIDAPDHL